jgi:hypothetical protein
MAGKTRRETTGKRNRKHTDDHVRPREVTRYVKNTVMAMLWGRAAGRCEFAGCNEPLWKSRVSVGTQRFGE